MACAGIALAEQPAGAADCGPAYAALAAKTDLFTADFLKQHDVYGQASFYENLTPQRTKELLDHQYAGYSGPLRLQFLGTLPEKDLPALLDPGIATRLPRFLAWAKDRPTLSPFELRQQFAASLGQRKVFRGMMLTAAEADEIRAHGMLARGLTRPDATSLVQKAFNPAEEGSGFADAIEGRLHGHALDQSLYMSASKWIELTGAGAWKANGSSVRPGTKFYLFEMDVPEISVYRMENNFKSLQGTVSAARYFQTQRALSAEQTTIDLTDPDAEVFLFGNVPPSEFKVYPYDQAPPKWRIVRDPNAAGPGPSEPNYRR